MSASEVQKLSEIELMVKQHLALPADEELLRHIAGILLEESPINSAELHEMIGDFFSLFKFDRKDSNKCCDELFASLRQANLLSLENKFTLSADKLDQVVVLENVLSMEEARQPLFAKKPTAGNSNTEMSKWRKKEKGKDKEKEKALVQFEKHMQEI